ASAAASAAAAARPGAAARAPTARAGQLDVKTMPRSRPLTLSVPSIGVRDSALIDLGKEADGSLEVPEDYGQAGWFSPGPAPGQFGPAVIAGHVDSKDGPGIFYRLGELRPGATVTVTRADGSTARFQVDKVERYPKDRFPTVAVYGDTTHRAELRLITCGGEFDRSTGHYVDNVVAYAHLL
ncbi:MAG: class F sortase, partial [Actinomycetota bacterium]|nr:class F sortase [Actinomycetota bacterium]